MIVLARNMLDFTFYFTFFQIVAVKKLQMDRDIMTKDLSDELRRFKLKEYAGIAYEAGAMMFSMFSEM